MAEQALATCENNVGLINQTLAFHKLVTLPDAGANAINRGNPYCEDYNEQMFCGATSNVNACANNQALGLALGTGGTVVSTTCGNGVVEAFEDCDDGVAGTSTQRSGTAGNGQPGDTCSTLCRSTR